MGQRMAIVGIGQTEHRYRRADANHTEMINEAVRRALEDAEISLRDVDAVVFGNMDFFEGHYLADGMSVEGTGAFMKHGMKINTGGTTGSSVLAGACHHVGSGLFDTVLAIAWEKQDAVSSVAGLQTTRDPWYDRQISAGAPGVFATMAEKYMRETGCREEHAAMVRVKAGENAARNPYAHVRKLVTIADVMDSRVIVWPLRLLHMSPTSCGACAMVVASEGKAKKISNKPVWVKDHVTMHREAASHVGGLVEVIPQPSTMELAAQKLYRRNGIVNPAKEIDVFEIYEPSSWAELVFMELFGFCGKGEAWKLVERGATSLSGELPVNPSGGVTCNNPIGASAMIRPAEAALQIRGDAGAHQVSKPVRTAFATAWGGNSWTVAWLLSKTP